MIHSRKKYHEESYDILIYKEEDVRETLSEKKIGDNVGV